MTLDEFKRRFAEHLAKHPKRHDPKQTLEDQICWFVAYQCATEYHDLTIKDIARNLLDGQPKIDMAYVESWLESECDPSMFDDVIAEEGEPRNAEEKMEAMMTSFFAG